MLSVGGNLCRESREQRHIVQEEINNTLVDTFLLASPQVHAGPWLEPRLGAAGVGNTWLEVGKAHTKPIVPAHNASRPTIVVK